MCIYIQRHYNNTTCIPWFVPKGFNDFTETLLLGPNGLVEHRQIVFVLVFPRKLQMRWVEHRKGWICDCSMLGRVVNQKYELPNGGAFNGEKNESHGIESIKKNSPKKQTQVEDYAQLIYP